MVLNNADQVGFWRRTRVDRSTRASFPSRCRRVSRIPRVTHDPARIRSLCEPSSLPNPLSSSLSSEEQSRGRRPFGYPLLNPTRPYPPTGRQVGPKACARRVSCVLSTIVRGASQLLMPWVMVK